MWIFFNKITERRLRFPELLQRFLIRNGYQVLFSASKILVVHVHILRRDWGHVHWKVEEIKLSSTSGKWYRKEVGRNICYFIMAAVERVFGLWHDPSALREDVEGL